MMKVNILAVTRLLVFLIPVIVMPIQSFGGTVEIRSEHDAAQLVEVVIQFIEQKKHWNRGDFRVTLRGIREQDQIGMFQGSHRDAQERYKKELETIGPIRQGRDPDDIVVFVDLIDLTPFEACAGVLDKIEEHRRKKRQ